MFSQCLEFPKYDVRFFEGRERSDFTGYTEEYKRVLRSHFIDGSLHKKKVTEMVILSAPGVSVGNGPHQAVQREPQHSYLAAFFPRLVLRVALDFRRNLLRCAYRSHFLDTIIDSLTLRSGRTDS